MADKAPPPEHSYASILKKFKYNSGTGIDSHLDLIQDYAKTKKVRQAETDIDQIHWNALYQSTVNALSDSKIHKGKDKDSNPFVVNFKHLSGEKRREAAEHLIKKWIAYGVPTLHGMQESKALDELVNSYTSSPTQMDIHLQTTMGVRYDELVNRVMQSENILADISNRSGVGELIAGYSQGLNQLRRAHADRKTHIRRQEHSDAIIKRAQNVAKSIGAEISAAMPHTEAAAFIEAASSKSYEIPENDLYIKKAPEKKKK